LGSYRSFIGVAYAIKVELMGPWAVELVVVGLLFRRNVIPLLLLKPFTTCCAWVR